MEELRSMGANNTDNSTYSCAEFNKCNNNGSLKWLEEHGQGVNVVLNYM